MTITELVLTSAVISALISAIVTIIVTNMQNKHSRERMLFDARRASYAKAVGLMTHNVNMKQYMEATKEAQLLADATLENCLIDLQREYLREYAKKHVDARTSPDNKKMPSKRMMLQAKARFLMKEELGIRMDHKQKDVGKFADDDLEKIQSEAINAFYKEV